MPFLLDNKETWLFTAEAGFHKHGVTGSRAQLLAIVKALLHDSTMCAIPSIFTSDVLERHKTLKEATSKRGDRTDFQWLD
ncbi:unnamed protein product [Schistosoma mattheei]|uniref:Uncharacterized protein n=1 Tax=Schistosoma mattheei TaxID=31246 RepID=A0A183PIB4_9TREM|nr:unnamed protein product [Schistosoma mattheei]